MSIARRILYQDSRDTAELSAGVILSTVDCIKRISKPVGEAATRIKARRTDCDAISSMARIIREYGKAGRRVDWRFPCGIALGTAWLLAHTAYTLKMTVCIGPQAAGRNL